MQSHLDDISGNRLVQLIYSCVSDDRIIKIMLQSIAEMFESSSAVLLYVDHARPSAEFSRAFGTMDDPAAQQLYQSEFAVMDPAPTAMSGLALGKAASTDLLFKHSMDRFKPFIEGFLHPLGLGGTLAGIIANEGGKTGFLGLHRARERRIFDESDIANLEFVLPHLITMLELRRKFYLMNERLTFLSRALDTAGLAVMALDGAGRLHHANIRTRDILARCDGLGVNHLGELTALDPKANKALRRIRTQPRANAVVFIPRLHGASAYGLRIVADSGAGSADAENGFLVSISDPDRASPQLSEELATAMGLTASSARLVSALLQGETLESYASSVGISRNTAKYHLRSAFVVMGVSRQHDLLKKIILYMYELNDRTS